MNRLVYCSKFRGLNVYEVYSPTYQRAETKLSVEEYLEDYFALKLECGRAVVSGDINISSKGMENDKIEYNIKSDSCSNTHKITFRGVPYTIHVRHNEPHVYRDDDPDFDDICYEHEDIYREILRILKIW